MSIDERVEQLRKIMYEIACLIEKTESEEEADEVFTVVEKTDKTIANIIWDTYVDWNKVSWIPEEAKKG